MENVTVVVFPIESIEETTQKNFTSSLSTISSENKLYISASNFADDLVILPNKKEMGRFHISTSDQAQNLLPIDTSITSVPRMKNSEDVKTKIIQLIQKEIANPECQTTKTPPPNYNKLWFPAPETCTDVIVLLPLQRKFHDKILNLQ